MHDRSESASTSATAAPETISGRREGDRIAAPVERRLKVSVVIPCLNEEKAITHCVEIAKRILEEHDWAGEVIVVDNASEDRSAELAQLAGARVVYEPRRGYGSAYLAGFTAARGDYIVMADADLTYDFQDIPRFVEHLEHGAELVMGNRMEHIQPGAMPWLHRYVGNPILTGILNLFFRTGVRDAHCGMRALRRDALPRLDLRTTGMEFASEMVIRAAKADLSIDQIPITYHPREGESKLSSFRDGWRHLRFLLVHSPTYLFLLPGAFLTLVGFLIAVTVLAQVHVFGRSWDLHAMIGGSMLTIVGTQILALGLCARAYGVYVLGERDAWFESLRPRLRLEHGLLAGSTLAIAGFAVGGVIVGKWIASGAGALSESKLALLAVTLVIVGVQTFFASFLLSILGLRRRS
ncbi:MAG: glycosyltransferase family 2 protein [Gaiellaceae bacterium]